MAKQYDPYDPDVVENLDLGGDGPLPLSPYRWYRAPDGRFKQEDKSPGSEDRGPDRDR